MRKFVACFIVGFVVLLLQADGCRIEICRKRRQAIENQGITLRLSGCSGSTPPWVAQVAFCLNVSSFELADEMRPWYERRYGSKACRQACESFMDRAGIEADIDLCIECFLSDIPQSLRDRFPTNASVMNCVMNFVRPFLSDETPTISTRSQTQQRANVLVNLPRIRPADNWWSLTVRLPCKPPLFRFINAYCINSFADDARSRDFVLAQNRLIYSRSIEFLVRFNDVCRFDLDQVEIVWDESIPAMAAPQLSSFPSAFPPDREEFGNIFFDTEAYEQYENTVGDFLNGRRVIRRKRSPRHTTSDHSLGIAMPCRVKRFSVTDENGNSIVMKSKGARYLLEPRLLNLSNGQQNKEETRISNFNFTLDFGYEETGCVFSSNEPETVVNPSPDWLNAKERIQCYTCRNAGSNEECRQTGKIVFCNEGEICQSEVRQIASDPESISITKSCKQLNACRNNWINNSRLQCRPGERTSVCRCCCVKNRCNSDAYHCT